MEKVEMLSALVAFLQLTATFTNKLIPWLSQWSLVNVNERAPAFRVISYLCLLD